MPVEKKVYQELAALVAARLRCKATGNVEWYEKHTEEIRRIVETYLPHGSGIDNGIKFDWIRSHGNKLVFWFSFHHMDEMGGYDGWTAHKLTVSPSLVTGYDMHIVGSNRDGIKEYLYDIFGSALSDVYTPVNIAECTAVGTLEDARNKDTDAEHRPVSNEW